jgi:hypothetical protein
MHKKWRFSEFRLNGIGSILFLKNGLKKIAEKYQNHLRSNNYDVCTVVAYQIPNILNVVALKNT